MMKIQNTKEALIWITNILKKHQIPFQIAGGLAARAYGATRPIVDIDIDIPEDKFETIKKDVLAFITYGPDHFKSDKWDLFLMTLNYQGQEIDLSGAYQTKIFNEKIGTWQKLSEDLSQAVIKHVLGLQLPVIPRDALLAYKKALSRDVDIMDINEIETNYNWLQHWESGEIAFHLPTVNPLLEKYWSELNIASSLNVFVPLCGKTIDLLWLANQGHHVIGVELSTIACEAFFVENQLSFNKRIINNFTCYYNDRIKLYCGDFFELSADILPLITAVYDRAALIALPDELRHRYVDHLIQLMAPSSQMLLIVYDSVDTVQGPPYPVSFNEVKKLYKEQFQISELTRLQKTDIPRHLRDKGYNSLCEVVYRLKKYANIF